MPKKRDPITAVIQYFQNVDLFVADQALTVVKEIVRSRQPVRIAPARTTGRKKTKPASAAHASGEGTFATI